MHGTQKPVECIDRLILNNSSPGEAIYEPFMGSGTTLIAADTTALPHPTQPADYFGDEGGTVRTGTDRKLC